MQDIKLIITLLPQTYYAIENIEDSIQTNDYTDLNSKITIIYNNIQKIFGKLPEEISSFNQINVENIFNWKNLILGHVFWKSFEFLKSIYVSLKSPKQINSTEIKNFLNILNEIQMDSSAKALSLIFASELCRTSDPELSFDLIIKAFKIKPDLGKILGLEHLKNYIYEDEIINEQKIFEKCIVCGGKGIPFHNAPSYKMSDYNDNFLPSKLWMKCEKCSNLYSKYFPTKFSIRNNPLKIIKPHQNITEDINGISSYILRSWCDILQNLKQYTDGKNILKIGIGNGALIATALEMNYKIDCVEIEEDVAQKISNLLEHEIICCDFLDLPEDKKYDIISMGDVIEHLDDPQKGLKKIHNLLEDNGVLWISTPNYKSAFNRLHKTTTAMWNEPWHITYFDKNGLENLLKSSGFKLLDYRISNHYNGSMEIIVKKQD